MAVFHIFDIIEQVPFLLSAISDLYSFRAINRTCHHACGNHVEYHTIQCKLGNDALWRHIINRPSLARKIRRLRIIPDVCSWEHTLPKEIMPLVPQHEQDGMEDEDAVLEEDTRLAQARLSERLLIRALKLMTNLESFSWDAHPPLTISSPSHLTPSNTSVEDVWTVLKESPALRTISTVDLTCDWYVPDWLSKVSPLMVTSPLWNVQDLEEFKINMIWRVADSPSQLGRTVPEPEAQLVALPPSCPYSRYTLLPKQIHHLLTRSPNLKSLTLHLQNFFQGWRPVDISSVFATCTLPSLQVLDLVGFSVEGDPAALCSFLLRHPKLKVLRFRLPAMKTPMDGINLCHKDGCSSEVVKEVLPELRVFDGPDELKREIETARGEIMRKVPTGGWAY